MESHDEWSGKLNSTDRAFIRSVEPVHAAGVSKETHLKALGARIRDLRKERGLTQEELAERAGLHSRYISRIELGGANFGVSVLFDLAKGLAINPADLF